VVIGHLLDVMDSYPCQMNAKIFDETTEVMREVSHVIELIFHLNLFSSVLLIQEVEVDHEQAQDVLVNTLLIENVIIIDETTV
jgi:hypothetical protein